VATTRVEIGIWWGWHYTKDNLPANLRITERELALILDALRRHVAKMQDEHRVICRHPGNDLQTVNLERQIESRAVLLETLEPIADSTRPPHEIVDAVRFVEKSQRNEVSQISMSLRLFGRDLCAYAKASAVLGRSDLEGLMSAAVDVARLISRITNDPTNPKLWPQFVTTGEFSQDPKIFQHPWRE
jgi:hypothetical protein